LMVGCLSTKAPMERDENIITIIAITIARIITAHLSPTPRRNHRIQGKIMSSSAIWVRIPINETAIFA
jgi:hypothetical protein